VAGCEPYIPENQAGGTGAARGMSVARLLLDRTALVNRSGGLMDTSKLIARVAMACAIVAISARPTFAQG
jgi:hypothetical protein